MRSYANKESAAVLALADIIAAYNTKQPIGTTGSAPAASKVISLPGLARGFRRGAAGKARGGDGLGSSVFRAAAKPLARLYRPLFTKAVLHGQEPLVWKHGTAARTT